jgi:hypothetical protein
VQGNRRAFQLKGDTARVYDARASTPARRSFQARRSAEPFMVRVRTCADRRQWTHERLLWVGARLGLVVRTRARWAACGGVHRRDGSPDGQRRREFRVLVRRSRRWWRLGVEGHLLWTRRPVVGFVLTTVGCLAGILPTIWTVMVPGLLLTLIIH